MRIWVVSRNSTPRAVFSTAGSAKAYIDGCTSPHDVSWFDLDACDEHLTQRFAFMPGVATADRTIRRR